MSPVGQTDIVLQPNGSTALAVRRVRPARLRPLLADQNVVPDVLVLRLTHEFWRAFHSEYHDKERGIVDLGCLDE